MAVILSGDDAIQKVRDLNGVTDPSKADEGTIRQRFGTSVRENGVHASDSEATAASEIALWFPQR